MNRAQKITESVDYMLLRPSIRDSFLKEKSKFRHQNPRPPKSQYLRVIRDLVDNQDFDCSTNPWTQPTIGQDAQASYYDPNPQSRWAPQYKRKLSEAKKTPPPAFLNRKKKAAPPDEAEVLQQNAAQDAENQQAAQQQIAQQGRELPPDTVSPEDAMQGQQAMPPQLPELPRDVRRSPEWEGNRAAAISRGLQTYSQKIADRYSIDNDVMTKTSGPRTMSSQLRKQQANWGDVRNRPRTNNGERI